MILINVFFILAKQDHLLERALFGSCLWELKSQQIWTSKLDRGMDRLRLFSPVRGIPSLLENGRWYIHIVLFTCVFDKRRITDESLSIYLSTPVTPLHVIQGLHVIVRTRLPKNKAT